MKKIIMLISLCGLCMLLLCQTVLASRAIWIDRDSTALATANTAVVYPIKGLESVSGIDEYLIDKLKSVKTVKNWNMASGLKLNTDSSLTAEQMADNLAGKADIFVVPVVTFRDSFTETSPATKVWTQFHDWEEESDDHGDHLIHNHTYSDYVWIPEAPATAISQEIAFAIYDKSGKLIMTYTMDWTGTDDRDMAEDICDRFADSLKDMDIAMASPAMAVNANVWSLPGYDFKSIQSIDLNTVPVKIDALSQGSDFYYEKAFVFSAQRAVEKYLKNVKADYNGTGDLRLDVEIVQFSYKYTWNVPYVTTFTRSDTIPTTKRVWDPVMRKDKEIQVKETHYWTEATPHPGYYTKKNSVVVKVNVYDKRQGKLVYTYNSSASDSDISRFDLYTYEVNDCFDGLNKLIQGES